jgi:Mrp family chromosome partitioning ATPase
MVSVNLALSIARQPHRSVLLVDLDLQKPQVANTLGVKPEAGVIQVLEGKKKLHEALVRVQVRNENAAVLPCVNSTVRSSAWMASQSMTSLLHDIKRDFRGWTVIIDLPPVLTSDDVITVLPQLDCVLFVAAIGTTTIAEIKECNKHLQSTSIVRVVANKAANLPTTYYSRYAHSAASVE